MGISKKKLKKSIKLPEQIDQMVHENKQKQAKKDQAAKL